MIAHSVIRLEDGSIRVRQYPNIEQQGAHTHEMIIPAEEAARIGAAMAHLALEPRAKKGHAKWLNKSWNARTEPPTE